MEQYISKSALLAEIGRLKADALQKKSQCKRSGLERMMHQIGAYNKILSFLDTLEVMKIGVDLGDPKGDKSAKYIIDTKTIEVKEMDLNKEIDAFFNDWGKDMINGGQYGINLDIRECKDIAKHFFELGLKAQKGE